MAQLTNQHTISAKASMNSHIVPPALLPTRAFYFLRHGQTQLNLERRFQGSIDVPLNENGIAQAREAARILSSHDFSRIISSPASRVTQTASYVAAVSGKQIHIENDLMELNVGSFEGQSISSIMKEHDLGMNDSIISVLPDDADLWHEFVPRVCAAVNRWTDRHAGETLLIAAHGLVFSALCLALNGERQVSRNAVPFHFSPNASGWEIKAITAPG